MLKVSHTGNKKLGKNTFVFSRAVGLTCPSSCDFLHKGCYAEQTEKQYSNARSAGLDNTITEKNSIRAMIVEAMRQDKSIRFMERGDWLINGELDIDFIENTAWACRDILFKIGSLPKMWFYTHVYNQTIPDTLGEYFSIFASVHNVEHMEEAKKMGFQKFAWCDTDQKIATKRPRGANKLKTWQQSLPKFTIINNTKFVICPEIRKGRDFVTCTGDDNSNACNMCLDKEKPNVLFPFH
jgi:hypothetical protein